MSKKVLIVDDSSFIRGKINEILGREGFDILGFAENGERAIDQILDLRPDIVTLDYMLPDMTGMDVLRMLQGKNEGIKIVIVSAVGQQSAIDEAKQLGATDYIIKPFTAEKLVEVIKSL